MNTDHFKNSFPLSGVSVLLILLLLTINNIVLAAPIPIDRVVVIVDEDIIMASELEEKITFFRNDIAKRSNQLPPENILRQQVLERLILESIQLQLADRAGLRVDDTSLNKTIERVAQQNNMTTKQFRQAIENEGQSYHEIREQIRRDFLISELRQKIVGRRIRITDQDVKTFMASDIGQVQTAANYHLGHILIAFPVKKDAEAIEKTHAKAKKIQNMLITGSKFQEVAIEYSSGQNALEGGDLGWRNTAQLPSLFVEQVKSMKINDISKPIRDSSGFHIIQLIDKKGGDSHLVKQTRARHILIKPNEIRSLDESESLAKKIRNEILGGEEFGGLAKTFSEDPSSARNGGELDWVSPGTLVPEFEKIMNTIKIGKISEPFLTQYGWHILEVLERRKKNMSKEYQVNQARSFLSKRRYQEELESWIREIRQEAYVEIKISSTGKP